MRCCQCDANDQGLSEYGIGHNHHSFVTLPGGDILCSECYDWNQELESDYYIAEEDFDMDNPYEDEGNLD